MTQHKRLLVVVHERLLVAARSSAVAPAFGALAPAVRAPTAWHQGASTLLLARSIPLLLLQRLLHAQRDVIATLRCPRLYKEQNQVDVAHVML